MDKSEYRMGTDLQGIEVLLFLTPQFVLEVFAENIL